MNDFLELKNVLGINSSESNQYFTSSTPTRISQIRPDITQKVEFKKANILNEIDKIDGKKPSLILCRNMWPYIDSFKHDDFAKKLYDKLAPGSTVIIGNYDCMGEKSYPDSNKFPQSLRKAGFKPIDRAVGIVRSVYIPKDILIYEK